MLNIPKSFTQSSANALAQAQISAASMGFERMGSGHLLIGLCRINDDLSRCLLEDLTSKDVEEEVARIYGRGASGFSRVSGMTGHAQRIIARTIAYANPSKKTLAGTAHLWFELLHEDASTAHQALTALGKSIEALKTALLNNAGHFDRPERASAIPASDQPLTTVVVHIQPGSQSTEQQTQPAQQENPLDLYTRDITKAAGDGKLEPLIGREKELSALVRILGKKSKNNPLLLGEPGVGKSALVEGLAQGIAKGHTAAALQNVRILSLDLAQMVAGSKYRGEFEDRIKKVLDCAQKEGNVILFIDEIHTLIGTGGSEGSLDAANLLKPALARGQVQIIGATTHKEYRKYVEKDPALARRFQRVDIDEPDHKQTLQILKGLRERYETYHHVTITDEALEAAVSLSARYVTDRFMPDKAIDLIDEAASMVRLHAQPATQPLSSATDDALSENGNQNLPVSNQNNITIGRREIAHIIAEWSGVPLEHVCASAINDTTDLESQLKRRIFGQDEAISSLTKAIRRAQAGLSDPARPLGVFMLLGPSGVGKTELCKALSELLFGRKDALIRIDMSEYSEEATISRLIGSPPGYVGHGEGGQLTDAVLNRPYSVVLFDEIEKAHPKVYNLLLQLLDDGILTDSVGRKVNFKNTLIMMTSNAGVSFDMDKQVGFGSSAVSGDEQRNKRILNKVRQVFKPEFLGRIDEVIVMKSLSPESSYRIAAFMLDEIAAKARNRNVELTYTKEVPGYLSALGVDEMSGARQLRQVIREQVENPLSDFILTHDASQAVIQLEIIENKLRLCHLPISGQPN